MDPELAKLLSSIVPPLITGLAVLGGAVVGQRIGRAANIEVLEINLKGQRSVARDNALRDHRQKQVDSLVSLANDRPAKYTELVLIARMKNRDELIEFMRTLALENMPAHNTRFKTPNSPAWKEAVNAFLLADDKIIESAERLLSQSPDQWQAIIDEIRSNLPPLVDEIQNLNRAAEKYVYEEWWT